MSKENPLFDYIKEVFESKDNYEKRTRNEKSKYFFMLQRLMSISFPIQAQAFNHIKVSQPEVSDYWNDNVTKLYKKTPQWIYTKTKKEKPTTKKADEPSDEATKIYLERTKMSRKELDAAVKMFGPTVLDPIRRIDEMLNE